MNILLGSRIILFTVLISTVICSCKKFVQIDPPSSQLLANRVYDDPSTAKAALMGLYAQMKDQGTLSGYNNFYMNMYADEVVNHSISSTGREDFFNNSVIPTNSQISTFWSSAYTQIFAANSILEGVRKSSKLSPADKNMIEGEVLAIRAFLHFNMVILFGDIPYVDTTDYKVNMVRSRLPAQSVYELIINDLKLARALLPEVAPDAERVRMNHWVATALMARVYLQMKDWTNAEIFSSAIIDRDDVYEFGTDIDKVFLKDSRETIWQLLPHIDESNTLEASLAILTGAPESSGISLSQSLINAFEPMDQRRIHWVGEYSQNAKTWYYAFKYKEKNGTTPVREYSIMFRITEQYLIRAEARAHLMDMEGAREDINKVRSRAVLDPVTADDLDSLLDIILHERHVEFFFEYGHRWHDLRRMGKADEVLSSVKPGWNITDTLLPIPLADLLVNPNMAPQNPGYE